MVLKFCGVILRSDDDLDATTSASRQRRLQELLRGDSMRHTNAKFKKEVRVFFDSNRPHGLVLGDASGDADNAGYTCRIESIDTKVARNEIANYNARCRAIGDYAHVVVEGMRVRALDGEDLDGVAFDDVVRKITKGCAGPAGCAVTFADVSSRKLHTTPKLKTIGNVVLAAQRAKAPKTVAAPRSPSIVPGSPTARARSVFNAQASPKVSKWSSVLTAVSESVKTTTTQADVLASDLAHKNAHLEAQILIFKGKLAALEREKAALEIQRDKMTSESTERLEELQTERQELETKLEAALAQCASLTQRCGDHERDAETHRAEFGALHAGMETLQHEHDGVVLQMQELQVEHRDVQHQAEELHSRLVAAQLVKSELSEQLTLLAHQQNQDRAALAAIQHDLPEPPANASDSPAIALVRQLLKSRDGLRAQLEELQIELSCHETTIQNQQDAHIELEDKLAALTQINASLRDQVRTLMAAQRDETVVASPRETVAAHNSSAEPEVRELQRQLSVERSTTARIQSALQALEDKARAKLELHEKEQLFLSQFKEQLVRGLTVTKYGARGNPHARVLFSDAQCRWLSWRDPSDGASSPRADAKAETLDLVEVLLGARSEIFAQHKPPVPARCLSLVFCHPCRTLDVEVETRERALFLRRGFRLLLEEVAEKRRLHEDDDAAVKQ